MRRDVKIGLAVGFVLFAVLITYLLVGTGHKDGQHPGAPLAMTGGEQVPVVPSGGAGTGGGVDVPAPSDSHTDAPANHDTPAPERATGGGADRATNTTTDEWDDLVAGRKHLSAGGMLETRTPEADRGTGNTVRNPVLDPDAGRRTTDIPGPASRPSRTYKVKAGDNLWTIAQATYGNGTYAGAIAQANPTVDPGKLHVDMTIVLPDPSEVVKAAPTSRPTAEATRTPSEQPIDPNTQYRVKDTDSLYSISIKLYGKADRVEKLHQLNKQLLGNDPSRLKVGWVLQLPEKPTLSQTH